MKPGLRGFPVVLLLVAGLLALHLCLPSLKSAEANPFDNFGLGSRSAAMGGAMTAVANDFPRRFTTPPAW